MPNGYGFGEKRQWITESRILSVTVLAVAAPRPSSNWINRFEIVRDLARREGVLMRGARARLQIDTGDMHDGCI